MLSERKQQAAPPAPGGFDLTGAARDLDQMAQRYAPIYSRGGESLAECIRLLHRNPWAAQAAREAIAAELAAHPERAVGLDVPLFDSAGRAHLQPGA